MTPEHHIQDILSRAARDAMRKYEAGQEEHGGRLWRKPIMEYIGDEIVDMIVYWYTFKTQWRELQDLLSHLEMRVYKADDVPKDVQSAITKALNMMYFGNFDGEQEEEKDARQC